MSEIAQSFPFRHFEAYLPQPNPTFRNPPFETAACRVLIARLSSFRDVDRSIPHLYLFQEARRALPEAYIDLSFMPAAHEREQLASAGLPLWIGTQSTRPVSAFDLVLISNAYTLELVNLPYLLLRSGMPLYASERDEPWPILLLGGSNAMASQAIIRPDGDSLVDGIFFGEGEGRVGELLAALAGNPAPDRRTRLERAAARIEGLWIAGALRETGKAVCAPDARHLPVEVPLLNTPEAGTANLQINYGCPAFCSFCFEGYDRKPYREIPLADLLAAAREIKRAQGVSEINLYSFNFNTHADILPLLLELHRLYRRVSVKSQRADILQHAGYLLEAEVEAGKHSFTIGVEGISERQRAWLHKSLPAGDLLALLERLFSKRIREVKLFFLLTGHETEDDLTAFRDLVRQVKAIRRERNAGIRVIWSFGLLVRMPFTPLRHDRLYMEEAHWRPLIGQVKSACETNGFEFRMAFDWNTYCVTQTLALGGHWLAEPIVALAHQGYCFDGTLPAEYWDQLRGRLVRSGHWSDAFLGEKGPDYPFALAFVIASIPPAFLFQQYEEARAGLDAGYCLGTQDERGRCLGCNACVDRAQREAITAHQTRLPEAGPYLAQLRDLVHRKRRLSPLWYRIRIDEPVTGTHPEHLNGLLFRALLDRYPELVDVLLDVQESVFGVSPPAGKAIVTKPGRFPVMRGESIYALYAWDAGEVARALAQQRTGRGFSIQVIEPVEGFVPGVFARCHLDLSLSAEHFGQGRRELEAYLQQAYHPYSLRRAPSQREETPRYQFDIPPKGARKRMLYGGTMESGPDGLVAGLDIGPRFDLLALLERFAPPFHVPYAGLTVSRIEW